MKKLLLYLLLAAMILSLFACEAKENEDVMTLVSSDGTTEYVIVRPEFGDLKESAAAKKLRDELKTRYNSDIKLNDDFVREGRIEAGQYEILVGATQRDESRTQELLSRDFVIKRTGNRIVILGGSPEYTAAAVDYFIENYFTAEGVVIPKNMDFLKEYNYPVRALAIEGDSIREFTVIYADGYENAAVELRDIIAEMSGIKLTITDDIEKAGEKHIRIALPEDKVNENTAVYTVKAEPGALIFSGGKKSNIRAAVDDFINKFFTGDISSSINLTGNIGIEGEAMIKTLRILAIGNSFSVNAMEYIYQIAEDLGADEVVLGNLYIPGCNLTTHWNNANTDAAAYEYYKNTTGSWKITPGIKMSEAIKEYEWDIITIQQTSGMSGRPDTYEPYLTNLIRYVTNNATNPDVRLAWHMTWAYQSDSTHNDFLYYGSDQMTMYNAILQAVQAIVLQKEEIDVIIPAGTAIQNVRAGETGDTLTRDGYHLNSPLGCYIAGLTWVAALTDFDISQAAYLPNGLDRNKLPMIIEAVNEAIKNPYKQFGEEN